MANSFHHLFKHSSMLFPVESITIASSEPSTGESARVESRRSRSIMSASVSANVADEPAVILIFCKTTFRPFLSPAAEKTSRLRPEKRLCRCRDRSAPPRACPSPLSLHHRASHAGNNRDDGRHLSHVSVRICSVTSRPSSKTHSESGSPSRSISI